MNRQIYSCPDHNYKSDIDGKQIHSPAVDCECIWNSKSINAWTKRKPIILKRGRSSWPVASNGKNQKNLRDTCRGSAGTAESLDNRKFNQEEELISRRNSFLYRSDSLNSKYFTCGNSAKSSFCFMDQQIKSQDVVTPFAQILLTLRTVKNRLTQIFHSNQKSFDISSENKDCSELEFKEELPSVTDTLSNLEWCLFQLENIQTHRSVSELATSKFKRLLSRELVQQNSKNVNKSICDFICQTFMDETPMISEEHLDDVLFNQNNWHSGEDFYLESPDENPDNLKIVGIISDHIINQWGPDIFQLEQNNEGCILRNVTLSILEIRKLFPVLKLDVSVMRNYLIAVENSYLKTNSYHNSLHAADVVQSVHVIVSMAAFKNVFSDVEIFSALLSAVIHDIDHPGLTSQFLINTSDYLAILYNDISVLENHHLAVGFRLIQKEGCNILTSFNRIQQQAIRRMVIDMVLATDMSKHMTMLADLKTMVETKKVSGSGILSLDNYNDRIQILQNLIHCADLSNPTKPLTLYKQWTERVMEEFFSQGDKEKELGIDSSPMCDRLTASVAKSQVSFIDFIVYPLWETWGELVQPEADIMLKNLCQNRQFYEQKSIENDLTDCI